MPARSVFEDERFCEACGDRLVDEPAIWRTEEERPRWSPPPPDSAAARD